MYTIKNCQGCGACYRLFPEYFAESDGYSYIKAQPPKEVVDKLACEHIVEIKETK
jgi:ferredoxin